MDGSVDDESGHSKGEEEFVEGEEDDAYWDCEECICSHTKQLQRKDKEGHHATFYNRESAKFKSITFHIICVQWLNS